MAVLQPEIAILDETDCGLDIDALRIVAEGVNAQLSPDLGVLLITHYQRLLNYITPDVVHVLAQGRIVASGGRELALRLEEEGYAPILREAGLELRPKTSPRRPSRAEAGSALSQVRGASSCMAIVPALDPVAIRADFPIFERDFSGRRLAYLDSAATALKPRVVADAMSGYMTRYTRQRPSRHLHDRRGGDGRLRGRAGARSRTFINAPRPARDRHGPQRDRGHQPRRLRVGPHATSARPTRSS